MGASGQDLSRKEPAHGKLRRFVGKVWLPLAITLLYLYNFPYFTAIHSANELPRIYLTMAMVDRGALNIDPELRRHQFTPDTASYKGRLYANKAPGMSFLTVPVYWVQKLAAGGETPTMPRMFFWFRIFASMVPALLFLLLLWRFLGELIPRRGPRRMVLAAYALGSMAMTYGTLLIAHQLSSLLMATAYFLVFLHARGKGGKLTVAFAGLAAGGGILVDYQVAFIAPPVGLYLLWVERRRGLKALCLSALKFGAAAAVPLAVLLVYQWGCFDDPFKTGYHYPTTQLFREWHSKGFLGMHQFNLEACWGSFFRADNGLFYFSPFLLLAVPGLVLMFCERRLRADAVMCLVLILFFFYFVSALTFWRSGWAVGPRYITCAIPYYLVPVAVLMGRLSGRWYGRIVPYGLMALSIVIYVTSNAVFPHFPENFSNPWFDVTLRFGRAGYLPYNFGWLVGLEGLTSVAPYLLLGVVTLSLLLFGGSGRWWQRLVVGLGAVALAFSIVVVYHHQLRDRRMPVPVRFLPWMERMWEPRHEGMHLDRLLPVGHPRTGGLATRR